MSNTSSISRVTPTLTREPELSIAIVALGGAGNLPVPVQEAQVVPLPPEPPKAPLIVRIDDAVRPYAVLGLFGFASIPLIACAGVMGYEALTGVAQELAFRKAYLLGQMAAFGVPLSYIGFSALASTARARFEAATAE